MRRTLGCPYDRVLGRVFAEVDPGLVRRIVAEHAGGWNAGLQELRLAVGGELVALSGHYAVTVGVDHVPVQPGLLVGAEAVRVQLADSNHSVLHLAVNFIPVHIERARELVVGTVLLKLGEGVRNQVRVQEADIGSGLRVRCQCSCGGVSGGVVPLLLDLIQAVGGTGHADVPLDELPLQGLFRRAHLELLDDPRVDTAGKDGGDDQHCRADDGQAPFADHCGDDEQDCHQRSRYSQDRLGGDDGVDVRVKGAGPASVAVLN
ncbi:hypothetical protein D9M72_370070 [compost metagenome]